MQLAILATGSAKVGHVCTNCVCSDNDSFQLPKTQNSANRAKLELTKGILALQ